MKVFDETRVLIGQEYLLVLVSHWLLRYSYLHFHTVLLKPATCTLAEPLPGLDELQFMHTPDFPWMRTSAQTRLRDADLLVHLLYYDGRSRRRFLVLIEIANVGRSNNCRVFAKKIVSTHLCPYKYPDYSRVVY